MWCFVADLCVVIVRSRGCAFDLLSLLGAVERWCAENHVSARRNVPTKDQNVCYWRSMRDGGARKHLLYISRDDTLRVRGCLHVTLPMWRSGALGVQVRYKQV